MAMPPATSLTRRPRAAWCSRHLDSREVAGTIELLAQSLRVGGIILIGEPYWRQLPPTEDVAKAFLPD